MNRTVEYSIVPITFVVYRSPAAPHLLFIFELPHEGTQDLQMLSRLSLFNFFHRVPVFFPRKALLAQVIISLAISMSAMESRALNRVFLASVTLVISMDIFLLE